MRRRSVASALALLGLVLSCSHREPEPRTSAPETQSATVPPAPRPMQPRTIGPDPFATPSRPAEPPSPATSAATAPRPSTFYPPTTPVYGNPNPSPPE